MPIRPRHVSVISAAVLVVVFSSCNDKSPTSPTPPPPTGPPAPTPATVVRLELVTGFADVNGGVRFVVGDAFYYYHYYGGTFDIAERITDFTLLIHGIADLVGTPARLSGPLQASIVTSRNTTRPFTPFVAQCHGSVHGFEMVRR